MVKNAKGDLVPPDDPQEFVDSIPEVRAEADIEYEVILNKDSTNMLPADWTTIAQAIYDRRDRGFDGFVVTHGTDTMHFSASAVAFALGRRPLPFPVVFTGAQTIPEVYHGDARVNLLRAVRTACEDLAEVVIVFGEYIFRACRAQKKDERRFDAFESPATFPLGYITERILLTPLATRRGRRDYGLMDFRPDFSPGVLQVSLIPGLEPELVAPAAESERCRGLILQSFGAGNVPDIEEFGFIPLIEHLTRRGKPVIVTSQFPANATLQSAYAPGRAAVESGAIPTGNMTSSCAGAKFRWVLAWVEAEIDSGKLREDQRLDSVRERMDHVFIDEMDESD